MLSQLSIVCNRCGVWGIGGWVGGWVVLMVWWTGSMRREDWVGWVGGKLTYMRDD